MARQSWILAMALLAGGWIVGGCGSSTTTLLYKPLTGERVEVPYPSVVKEEDGVAIYVGPDATRIIRDERGKQAARQDFVVELLVRNKRDEAIVFQTRNVSIVAEGNTGRAVEDAEVVLKPGEHTGRYDLHIPITGRGKPDAREDQVELVVEVKGVTSGRTIAVRVRLLFVVTQL
jgi:hypothetical protein